MFFTTRDGAERESESAEQRQQPRRERGQHQQQPWHPGTLLLGETPGQEAREEGEDEEDDNNDDDNDG